MRLKLVVICCSFSLVFKCTLGAPQGVNETAGSSLVPLPRQQLSLPENEIPSSREEAGGKFAARSTPARLPEDNGPQDPPLPGDSPASNDPGASSRPRTNETGEWLQMSSPDRTNISQGLNYSHSHRRPKGLLSWLFGKGDPPPEKQYLFPDKKSVPIRAQVTLHPSESWTNLMMSFHPSNLPQATNAPLIIEEKPTEPPTEKPAQEPTGPPVDPIDEEYYPVDITIPSIPWYPYYPPQPAAPPGHYWENGNGYYYEGQWTGANKAESDDGGRQSSQHQAGHNGQNQGSEKGIVGQVPNQFPGQQQTEFQNGFQGHKHPHQYLVPFGGNKEVQGEIKVADDYPNWNQYEQYIAHGGYDHQGVQNGAYYGYRPPSHPHRNVQQKRASDPDSSASPELSRQDASLMTSGRRAMPTPVNAQGAPRWYHYHIPVPANSKGARTQKIRLHLPPGVSKDKVVVNIHPVYVPPSRLPVSSGPNHPGFIQGPLARAGDSDAFEQGPLEPTELQQPSNAEEAVEEEPEVSAIPAQRRAVLQDPSYLQRILAPAMLSRPPAQHVLVPQGPAGEEIEARLMASKGHQGEEAIFGLEQGRPQPQPSGSGLIFEDGFEPTRDFSHFPQHSFTHQQFANGFAHDQRVPADPSSSVVTAQGTAGTQISGHMLPPPPPPSSEEGTAAEESVSIDERELGPGVTSRKEEVQNPSLASSQEEQREEAAVDSSRSETQGTIQHQQVPFTSYPGNPSQDWGESYTGLRFPPYDSAGHHVLDNQQQQQLPALTGLPGGLATQPVQGQHNGIRIQSQSSVSMNNQLGTSQARRPSVVHIQQG